MEFTSYKRRFYTRVTLPKVWKLVEAAVFSERITQKYTDEDGIKRSKAEQRKKPDDVVKDESEDETDQDADDKIDPS